MTSLLGLGDLDLTRLPDDSDVRVTRSSPRRKAEPVAIIGMSGRIGAAANLAEFWSGLLRGEEFYGGLSARRRADIDAYLAARGVPLPIAEQRYAGGTRLPSLDEFDHRFFSLSRQEAKAIDPNQRVFLETAWAALEDSGYLSADLGGGRVGVYAGMSADFGEDYRAMVRAITPDASEVAVAGNIRSMIASRIAYLLDLRGPSLLVDTACSSGLVAAYTAYRAIQNGECSLAIVGAVKCDLVPVDADGESGVGTIDIGDTLAGDRHTRTFDRKCDGTSAAEGCVVFVLKSLERARRDGDHVHAVIMGGAVNQDGASNGITAPNAQAQADLITEALADAGVGAEQISFIEAHGTATRLGDPVEISGIDRAFSRQTARKQFCGIGTVKTNIGHLDNASGLAGLAKLVLSLRHRTLPASLNFEEPNQNISFPGTALFVNDRTVAWPADERETLYAGINSFGLSGTNCHLVVRGPDPVPPRDQAPERPADCHLLPLSARTPTALHRLAESYRDVVTTGGVHPADLTFTASTGRLHHGVRAAFVFGSTEELGALLTRFLAGGDDPDVRTGEFRLAVDKRDPRDLLAAERDQLDREASELAARSTTDREILRGLADRYVRGADLAWRDLARDGARRVPLPTYPFERTRCWVEADRAGGGLLDDATFVRSLGRDLVICRLGPRRRWELAEHRIHGVSVLPGTGLVEMMVSAARRLGLAGPALTLRRVQFAAPLAVPDGQDREVHLVLDHGAHDVSVTVASRAGDGDEWVVNATAELGPGQDAPAPVDLDVLGARLSRELVEPTEFDSAKGLEVSDRWTATLLGGRADESADELLYEFELPAAYQAEIADYALHPSLFDTVINAPSNVYDQQRLYLPFSYGTLRVHDSLPARVLAHFRKRPESVDGTLHAFDVTVTDPAGRVLLSVDNYCVKSAEGAAVRGGDYGYVQRFRPADGPAAHRGRGTVLLLGTAGELAGAFASAGYDCVHVPDPDTAPGPEAGREFALGVLACWPTGDDTTMADRVARPVERALALLTLVSAQRWTFTGGLVTLTREALAVTGEETGLDPGQAGVLGLMRVAALEYATLGLRAVDTDWATASTALVAEAGGADRPPLLLYRDGTPFEPHVLRHPVTVGGAARPLPADGAIVVSGGTGDLGTVVAGDLARRGARRLVLLGSDDTDRTRPEWTALAADLDAFEVLRLDLADQDAVDAAIRGVRERHGRVSGVLHLAGRPGAGFLYTKDTAEFLRVYRPKALGAVHLHEATLVDEPDFFVLFSSIATLLLNQGQADYTAANLVLDGLADRRAGEGLTALSVQWPAWRETGIARRMDAADEDEAFPPLDTAEALALLSALLGARDLPSSVMPGRARTAARPTRTTATSRPAGGRQVVLHGLDEVGDAERAVAEIWAQALDIDAIDVHDDFAALGGNSLLTAAVLKLYDQRFPALIDITDLFRYTTVAEQAACLRERLGTGQDAPAATPPPAASTAADDIDSLLDLFAPDSGDRRDSSEERTRRG
ncbi:short-chain dehydrogenase [Actinophytocola xinjiangensis]|uniref:Short-chain dehydrogenase n=1 Tax=Actinophytocola xinjiangensis TaxID=485602 RepID=A0A7Z0WMD4_9PSEU|nr:SDR family NAD(P)-dependent oxidoreductase [Actinophytocola xinjiangensis]OLF10151.1 short-chain dehydrogenase [Actinophytocola xinjiangensis]